MFQMTYHLEHMGQGVSCIFKWEMLTYVVGQILGYQR